MSSSFFCFLALLSFAYAQDYYTESQYILECSSKCPDGMLIPFPANENGTCPHHTMSQLNSGLVSFEHSDICSVTFTQQQVTAANGAISLASCGSYVMNRKVCGLCITETIQRIGPFEVNCSDANGIYFNGCTYYKKPYCI